MIKDAPIKSSLRKCGSPREVSEIFGLSKEYLNNCRYQGIGPPYYRIGKTGRKIMYFIDEFEQWMKRHPVITSDSREGR